MRPFLLMLTLLATPALAGEPLLVPDFTPHTASEVALSAMLQDLLKEELKRDGHVLIQSEHAKPIVGDIIDRCGERQGCPYVPLQKLPARFAVVVTIVRFENSLTGTVDFYEQADPTPIATREVPIEPGNEAGFAAEIRRQTEDLLALLGPAPSQDLIEAVRLIEGADAVAPAPAPQPVAPAPQPVALAPQPVAPAPVPAPVATDVPSPAGTSLEKRLEGSSIRRRHLTGNLDSFMRFEGEPEEWAYRMTPHAGRVFIELRGGYAMGDIHRRADVRLNGTDPVTEWYQEGPEPGTGGRGGLYAGYSPITFMDVGLLVEFQAGMKTLSTGFGSDSPATSQGSAMLGIVQPRVRFYAAPLGPVKPALFVGAEFQVFDAYRIDPNPNQFPEPIGGVVPGVVGGGGLVIDPAPIIGIVLEAAYTQHFGARAGAAEDGRRPDGAPSAPTGQFRTLAFSGGLQFRI
ncbi:MAG: hypothetical protein KC912_00780 [Proteobacteria bacterium]|nr:hypothetical protein [Pseudomonadota bacterium]